MSFFIAVMEFSFYSFSPRLAEIHGSDWVGIGEVMGRSSMSLNRKYAKLVNGRYMYRGV